MPRAALQLAALAPRCFPWHGGGHRVQLNGLGINGLDPMSIRPGKDDSRRDRCMDSMLFASVPDCPIAHTLLQPHLSWQPLRTRNQQTNWYYQQCPVVVAVGHLHHLTQEKDMTADTKTTTTRLLDYHSSFLKNMLCKCLSCFLDISYWQVEVHTAAATQATFNPNNHRQPQATTQPLYDSHHDIHNHYRCPHHNCCN